MKIFTTENIKDLQQTSKKIFTILDEEVDGNLMLSQKQYLATLIKDFLKNPIVSEM